MRTAPQTVQNLNTEDIPLLASAMEEMGLKVRLLGGVINFSGTLTGTRQYVTGAYQNGKLTSDGPIDLGVLARYTAVASMKAQVQQNNSDKYRKTKTTLTKISEFKYEVQQA